MDADLWYLLHLIYFPFYTIEDPKQVEENFYTIETSSVLIRIRMQLSILIPIQILNA